MEHTFKKPRFTRLASLLLALAMVLSMFPVTAFAAESSVTLYNAEGEETTTFTVGDPIYVEYNNMTVDADWICMFAKPAEGSGYASTYHLYQYASEDVVNLFDGVWTDSGDFWNGMWLDAGDYELWLNNSTYLTTFTLEDPEDTTPKSMVVAETTVAEGAPIQVTAVNYSEYSWVAIYNGFLESNPAAASIKSIHYYYCLGHEGVTMEWNMEPGKYTIAMYDDYNGAILSEITPNLVHVTVGDPEEEPEIPDDAPALATDKTEYKFGEPIMVTTNYSVADAWVGIYKKGETYDPNNGGVKSIFWYYLSEKSNPVDIRTTRDENSRGSEFVGGEYTIVLFKDGGYTPHASVDIVVTAEIDTSVEPITVAPTCTEHGTITYTMTDGTTKVVTYPEDESLEMLGHDYEGVTPTFNLPTKEHTYACKNNCGEPKIEACTPNAGVITEEAEGSNPGTKHFTCTVCNGEWDENYYLGKYESSREKVKEATCQEMGQWKIYWKNPETGEDLEPTYEDIPVVDCEFTKLQPDAENLQHQKVCKWCATPSSDPAEDCSATPVIDANPENNCYNFECACGNSWIESIIILEDNDAVYHLNDLVKVKLNPRYTFTKNNQWIGLYHAGEVPAESTSMWYQYLSDVMNGNPYGYFDISQKHTPDGNREDNLSGYGLGEYLIYLSNTGDYDDAATIRFTVEACKYDQKVEAPEFLKGSAATCQKGATYYYSCTCGAVDKSENAKTFEGAVNPDNHEKTAGWTATAEGHQKAYACCGATLGDVVPHADTKTKDHKCDECGYEMSKHEDANKDHKCDNGCTVDIGEHKDANKDHKCDYGCSVAIGTCEDKNGDGKCDYGCDKEFEVKPTEPDPTDPEPTEPDVTEPDPTEPDPTEPDATEPEAPKTEGVTRLAGENRLVTSELIANQLKEKMGVEKFQNIIVASGGTFADALPGSYLAAVKNAPIVLTLAKQKYIDQTANYIKANLAEGGTVYILGGESAVPKLMEEALAGINVKRVAGADRFGTNLAILKEAGVKAGDEILVCTAKEFADSLSAAATGKPILLVYKKITDEQKTYLGTLSGCKFTVVGGTTAVPENLEEAMKAYGEVSRLAGKDRLDTSILVAKKYFPDATSSVVAFGWDFPDGLCGGSLAYATKSPLILAHSKEKLAQFTADYTVKAGLKAGYVLGGDGLVDDAATRTIFGMGSEAITQIK